MPWFTAGCRCGLKDIFSLPWHSAQVHRAKQPWTDPSGTIRHLQFLQWPTLPQAVFFISFTHCVFWPEEFCLDLRSAHISSSGAGVQQASGYITLQEYSTCRPSGQWCWGLHLPVSDALMKTPPMPGLRISQPKVRTMLRLWKNPTLPTTEAAPAFPSSGKDKFHTWNSQCLERLAEFQSHPGKRIPAMTCNNALSDRQWDFSASKPWLSCSKTSKPHCKDARGLCYRTS